MKKNYILAFYLFAFLFIASNTYSQIIRVPKDYKTIQSAVNAAAIHDTILVDRGRYYENVNFKGSCRLK